MAGASYSRSIILQIAQKRGLTPFRVQQFSVIALTDNSGGIVERYAYSAYGEPVFLSGAGSVISSSTEDNRYAYTGREWDATQTLYHFRERNYFAIAGRFTKRDPLGYWDGTSLYASYFFMTGVDPSGKCGGTCVARLAWDKIGKCGLHIDRRRREVYYGFELEQTIQFENRPPASCSCCKYQQLIIEARESAVMIRQNGRPVHRVLRGGDEDIGGEGGDEDCIIVTLPDGSPYEVCYGSRTPRPPGAAALNEKYFMGGCAYKMLDRPGIEVPFEGLGHDVIIRFSVRYRFLANVVDVCNNNRVVLSTVVESSCSDEINFKNF